MDIGRDNGLEFERTGIDLLYCLLRNHDSLGFELASGLIEKRKGPRYLNYALDEVEEKIAGDVSGFVWVNHYGHIDIDSTFDRGDYSTGDVKPYLWLQEMRKNRNREPSDISLNYLPETIYNLALKCPPQVEEIVSLTDCHDNIENALRLAAEKLTEDIDGLIFYNENGSVANPGAIEDDILKNAILAVNKALNERFLVFY